jgi:hypothetical protein
MKPNTDTVGSLLLCDECIESLERSRLDAKPNKAADVQWCDHRGVHAFLCRGKLTTVRCPTAEQADAMDRAYAASMAQLLALEAAMLAAVRSDEKPN